MLTKDLLRTKVRGQNIAPCYIDVNEPAYQMVAEEVIEVFVSHIGRTFREMEGALKDYTGFRTDYKVVRGLAKLIEGEFCQIEVLDEIEPASLRREVFQLAREHHPVLEEPTLFSTATRREILEEVAARHNTSVERIEESLYADLRENRRIPYFTPPTKEWLLNRYNLALAQGVLYDCTVMSLSVYRNQPSHYKQLFRHIKLCQLIHTITGDVASGYRITLDGPASLFKATRAYGIRMARFLPAVLLCQHWQMDAEIRTSDGRVRHFRLDERCGLVSHYLAFPLYDSQLERNFAERFAKLKTEWRIERETEVINLKESVFIPDFTFCHPDGRFASLEIVGYWRPDYLRKKWEQLRKAGRDNLLIAVNSKLNVSEETLGEIPGNVFFFKNRIDPEDVLARLEARK